MTSFAIQIDLTDGGTHHMFGSGEAGLAQAYIIRDGWRDQPSSHYYTFAGSRGKTDIYVRDIRDVRIIEGGR